MAFRSPDRRRALCRRADPMVFCAAGRHVDRYTGSTKQTSGTSLSANPNAVERERNLQPFLHPKTATENEAMRVRHGAVPTRPVRYVQTSALAALDSFSGNRVDLDPLVGSRKDSIVGEDCEVAAVVCRLQPDVQRAIGRQGFHGLIGEDSRRTGLSKEVEEHIEFVRLELFEFG